MHISGQVNPNMVVLAREARGFTQQDLAQKINLHKANVSRLEKGDTPVSQETLTAISEATSFPLQFFLQDGSPVPVHLSYRKRQHVPVKLITPIEARINIIRRHVQLVTRALQKPVPQVPVLEVGAEQTPSQAAQKLRKLWRMDAPVVENMVRVLEWQGIIVCAFPFGTERVDSRSMLTEDKYPVVFINSSHLGDRLRYSLAYELAQLVMHTFVEVPAERDISREANEFAAEFLMPEAHIMKDFERGITLPLLGELKRKWKVSMISLLYRADDLGLLTPNQKRYLIQQFNQQRIRRREPEELDVPKEQPKLMRQMLAEYMSRTGSGIIEMSAMLSLDPGDYVGYYG
ncbi:MAG: ImmA/IrrE family metallo-endopeptidase [Chitinophagaceae bacterium]|nr:MAG: ImmA/IrrE family metallo-endopeptidase [Chitinophagaceae bacterium]